MLNKKCRGLKKAGDIMDISVLYQDIARLGAKYNADKIVLFGSRARGDYRQRSDIDIAVYGMPLPQQAAFWMDLEDLPTLLKIDVIHVIPRMNEAFLKNIEREGGSLYEKN